MAGRVVDTGGVVGIVGIPGPFATGPTGPIGPIGPVLPIIPGDFTLGVYRGDTYEWVFQLLAWDGQPVDIMGWRFKADIRTGVNGTLMAGLQRMQSVDSSIDLLTEEGRAALRMEWANGLVRMRLTSDQSRGITGPGWWDLETTTPDGWVKTVLRGPVQYLGDITTGEVVY